MPIRDRDRRAEYERRRNQTPEARAERNKRERARYAALSSEKKADLVRIYRERRAVDPRYRGYLLRGTKKWQANNPDHVRAYRKFRRLKIEYGISVVSYLNMLHLQNQRCLVCKTSFDDVAVQDSRLARHVDHDHSTGKLRGVLCHYCNVMIGHASESPAVLRKAADYLEASK